MSHSKLNVRLTSNDGYKLYDSLLFAVVIDEQCLKCIIFNTAQ